MVYGGGNLTYCGLFILSIILGAATQAWVNSTFRRYSLMPTSSGETGAQAARRILDASGLTDVRIEPVAGNLTDHYDPRTKVLGLSEAVYGTASVSAAGVAAHEAGHALQDAAGYTFGKIRTSLVPVASFGSRAWPFLIIVAILTQITQLFWLAIVLFAGSVLFQLVTLPVEFDASRRAMEQLEAQGVVSGEQVVQARSVLTAAAMTYVAAALISVLYLLYYVGLARRS